MDSLYGFLRHLSLAVHRNFILAHAAAHLNAESFWCQQCRVRSVSPSLLTSLNFGSRCHLSGDKSALTKSNQGYSVQFGSVPSLDRLGHRGDMRDDLAEILFQPFLQKALVGSSCLGRDVHSFTLSIQHFLCQPQRRPATLQWGALKDDFGEAVTAWGNPYPPRTLRLFLSSLRSYTQKVN